MHRLLLLLTFVLAATLAGARSWTYTDGKTIEANVVEVKPDEIVALKTAEGQVLTVPFNTFVAKDVKYLEKLHHVLWKELNKLFGLEIWQDNFLWDDPTAETAKRMGLQKESKTDFMENHRAYPRGKKTLLGEAVYASVLYGGKEQVDSLSFVFLNQGDIPIPNGRIDDDMLDEIADKIEASGMRVHDTIAPVLGKPKRESLGRKELREKLWRWDWNGHAIMLTMQEGKYAALRIMPSERADRGGRVEKIKGVELRERMAACVERRDNGDVVIRNVPMIDQGPKGYCSPATWERYLRYMEIPVDMYLLALVANTGIGSGGGTYSQDMINATSSIISSNGRKLIQIGDQPTVRNVSKHIDKGLPIMWRLMSTPSFQRVANNNTAKRNGKQIGPSGQTEDTSAGGHICLIVGYNKKTDEIAISDSWGARYTERWVPVEDMVDATNGEMNVIKW